jgi:outer membrane protein assembly factor BamB
MDRGLPNTPPPLLYGGAFYLIKDGGILHTVDPKNGEVIEQGRLEGAIDKYWASPVGADGRIYFVSEACSISVVAVDESNPGKWKPVSVSQLQDTCFATPTIADGRIYVRTKSALYSFGLK